MGRKRIAGFILAGGENKRMHGRNKALLQYEEKPFWKWIVETMYKTDEIYISVAKKSDYELYGEYCFEKYQLVEDLYERRGPLGGILSGLSICKENALLVMPCDMIGCTKEMVDELIEVFQKDGTPAFYKEKDIVLPFPGIYTKSMIPVIKEMMKKRNYKLRDLIQTNSIPVSYLEKHGIQEILKNVNTLEEYEELLHDSDRGSNR